MPNLNTTRSEIEQFFITGWGATTPISFDNTNYNEVQGGAYVHIQVQFSASPNVCIGAAIDGMKRQRHSGLIVVRFYTPLNEGAGAAYELADTYKGIMDNKNIVTNLLTYTTDVRRSGEEVDGFWSLIGFTEFTSDE